MDPTMTIELRALVTRVAERGQHADDGDLLSIASALHAMLIHAHEVVRVNATLCDLLESALDVIHAHVPPATPVDDTITVGDFVTGVRLMLSDHHESHAFIKGVQ